MQLGTEVQQFVLSNETSGVFGTSQIHFQERVEPETDTPCKLTYEYV